MALSTIKLYGLIAAAATVDSVASIDIPEDSDLHAITGWLIPNAMPDNGTSAVAIHMMSELSFLSTNQFTSNDARGEIIQIVAGQYREDTLGGAASSFQQQIALALPKPINLMAGERIHAHTFSSNATLTGYFSFLLYIESKGGGRRAARRR